MVQVIVFDMVLCAEGCALLCLQKLRTGAPPTGGTPPDALHTLLTGNVVRGRLSHRALVAALTWIYNIHRGLALALTSTSTSHPVLPGQQGVAL
jgi:hypothetical protein